MKKIISALIVFLFILTGVAYAHPPKEINLDFDKASGTISAVVVHPVNNPAEHYIKTVEISLNGALVNTQNFTKQDNAVTQFVSYVIKDAKPGDTVSVKAYCSIQGDKENSIKVE